MIESICNAGDEPWDPWDWDEGYDDPEVSAQ